MLKYREYNTRPYSLQRFIQWVQNIENATSERQKIERINLNWKLIELDLNRCAKNESLRHKIWSPMPLENPDGSYQNPEAGEMYCQYMTKNKISFAGCSSIVDYIFTAKHSPIKKMECIDDIYHFDEYYSDEDNYYIHPSNLVAIARDAVHICKLLVKCNIVSLADISYKKLTSIRINGYLDAKLSKISIGEQLQTGIINLLKHQNYPKLSKECIDFLVLFEEKNIEFNCSKFNTFAQMLYDENSKQWHCNLFSNMKHWVPLKSTYTIWERLLFRGIKSFQCEAFTDNKWMEFFIQEFENTVATKNCIENIESLASPFIIYPYFIRAKIKMKNLLKECIDVFPEDCIYVVMSYVFHGDLVYSNCYNKYRNQLLIKAVEFLHCLQLINDITPNQNHSFLHKYCDDIACIKYCFNHFQSQAIERMGVIFAYKLLMKYKLFQSMSIEFHYDFLRKVIRVGFDGYRSRYYYTENNKRRLIPKFDLFLAYIKHLNAGIVAKLLNHGFPSLLWEAVSFKRNRMYTEEHLKIIQFIVKHKSVNINDDFETNSNNGVFERVVENRMQIIISLLLKSGKVSELLVCKTILQNLRSKKYVRYRKKDRNIVQLIQKFLNMRSNKCTNSKQRKMLTRTVKMLRKWFRQYGYSKYCDFTKVLR